MKRVVLATAAFAAAALLSCLGRPALAATQVGGAPPPAINSFVDPIFEPGFEPIPPTPSGLSPDFNTLVLFDRGNLRLVNTVSGITVFNRRFSRTPDVGFTVDGEIAVVQEPLGQSSTRLLLVESDTGLVLEERTVRGIPEVRVSFFGASIVVVEPLGKGKTRLLLFNDAGNLVLQRSLGPLATFGLGIDSIVILDPVGGDKTKVQAYSFDGLIVLNQTVKGLEAVGYDPFGFTLLVVSRETGGGLVRLIDGLTGDLLVTYRNAAPTQAGFTEDGSILAIITQRGTQPTVLLFSTFDGRRIL